MSEITILHLSDIHFKKQEDEQNKACRQDVRQKLIHAVKAHSKEQTPPDVVAVTGDIAFSGKKPEYNESLKFFEKLKTILPKDTPILAVPGNHDVDRSKVDDFFSLQQNIVHKKVIDKFLQSKGDRQKKTRFTHCPTSGRNPCT